MVVAIEVGEFIINSFSVPGRDVNYYLYMLVLVNSSSYMLLKPLFEFPDTSHFAA